MRKNVGSQVIAFQMNSATNGSPVTGGTPVVYYTIDGGTQQTGGGATAVSEGNGQWTYVPLQAETNGAHVAFTMVLATAITQTLNVWPVSYNPGDAVRLGLTAFPDAAANAAGGLPVSIAGGLDLDAVLSGNTPQTGDTYALANGVTGFVAIDTVVDAVKAKTDQLTFTTTNKVDSRMDYVGSNMVTSPDDFKADLTAVATAAALGAVDTVVDAIQAVTDNLPNSGALTSIATAAALGTVDTVVDSILAVFNGAMAEPTAVPAANGALKDKINWTATLARNKLMQTATTQTLRNDVDGADIATAAVSDDGTTFTRAEWS